MTTVAHKKSKYMLLNYPAGAYFCLINEFAERYAVYGIQAILTFYLLHRYEMTSAGATVTFHAFICFSYFTPFLGSIWADGFSGPYKVILYLEILYCLGPVLLTISSLSVPALDNGTLQIIGIVGLFIVALCSGGRKSCMSAFSADQFPETMVEERNQYFSCFYFVTYVSALLAQLTAPFFRGGVKCMGEDTCFPMAYGTMSIFIVICIISFICGKRYFTIPKINTHENLLFKACKCIFHGFSECLKSKIHSTNEKSSSHDHWLDYAQPKYDRKMVEDVKNALSVCLMFLPMIVMWALYFQIGSTFVIQANLMDGRIGQLTILPDQLVTLSSVFLLVLIPFQESVLFPLLGKCKLLTTSLQRLGFGAFLAAISFVMAGFVQLKLTKDYVTLPPTGQAAYVFVNYASCPVNFLDSGIEIENNYSATSVNFHLPSLTNLHKYSYVDCEGINNVTNDVRQLYGSLSTKAMDHTVGRFVIFWETGEKFRFYFKLKKTSNGNSRLYMAFDPILFQYNNSFVIKQHNVTVSEYGKDQSVGHNYVDIRPLTYGSNVFDFYFRTCSVTNVTTGCHESYLGDFEAKTGSVHALITSKNMTLKKVTLVSENTVNLMWQAPQYCLLAASDMLVSVYGVEFSYTQASPNMKSLLQGFRLLTTMAGNILDMAVNGSKFITDPAVEFFAWAGLMTFAVLIFVYLAMHYKYVEQSEVVKEKIVDQNDENTFTSL